VQTQTNTLGKLSASVIRRDAIDPAALQFSLDGIDEEVDMATWLAIADAGDVAQLVAVNCRYQVSVEAVTEAARRHDLSVRDWGLIIERSVLFGVVTPGEATRAWETYLPIVSGCAHSDSATEHEPELAEALHDLHVLAVEALGGGRLTGIVLSDGNLNEAIHTAYGALAMLDDVVVLERGTNEGTAALGLPLLHCDWMDNEALTAAVAELGAGPVVLIGAGEELMLSSTMRARAELFTVDFRAGNALVDTSQGLDSRVLRLRGEGTGRVDESAFWIRSLYTPVPEAAPAGVMTAAPIGSDLFTL
jgi:hypothetical protein